MKLGERPDLEGIATDPEDRAARRTPAASWGCASRSVDPRMVPGVKQGAMIIGVDPGSPADRAGLQPGMVVVEAGGKPVRNPSEFAQLVRRPEARHRAAAAHPDGGEPAAARPHDSRRGDAGRGVSLARVRDWGGGRAGLEREPRLSRQVAPARAIVTELGALHEGAAPFPSRRRARRRAPRAVPVVSGGWPRSSTCRPRVLVRAGHRAQLAQHLLLGSRPVRVLGVQRAPQVLHLLQGEGAVARAHQGLGIRRLRLAPVVAGAALAVAQAGGAGTGRGRGHGAFLDDRAVRRPLLPRRVAHTSTSPHV